MADHKRVIGFIKKKAGGLSQATTDSASISCQSGCTATYKKTTSNKWHTNEDITWCTFNSWADKKGIPQSKRCELFISMPDNVWEEIFKTGFWDKAKGDEIKSQAIAEYLVNGKWGNPSTATTFLEQALKKNGYTNVDRDDIDSLVSAVNKIKSEAEELKIFNDFVDFRVAWLKSLPGAKVNKGWFKRQDSFRKRGKALIKGKKGASKVLYKALGIVDSDYRTFAPGETEENGFDPKLLLMPSLAIVGALAGTKMNITSDKKMNMVIGGVAGGLIGFGLYKAIKNK
jgi:lysozyme family protein